MVPATHCVDARESCVEPRIDGPGTKRRYDQQVEMCTCQASEAADGADERRREIIVPLVLCPEVCAGTKYSLVRRDDEGAIILRYSGMLTSPHPSLNLAKLRQRGARLGAGEVELKLPLRCRARPNDPL